MKPYILVLYNFFKLNIKKITCKKLLFNNIEMLSFKTELSFHKLSNIHLGKHIVSDGYNSFFVDNNAELYIGDSVYFNEGTMISCKGHVSIGNRCLFGPNVKIFDNNHKFDAVNGVNFNHSVGSVEIGEGTWIASNVVLLKGTKIGKNCVIGAGCIINCDIPDCSIVTQSNNLVIEKMKGI